MEVDFDEIILNINRGNYHYIGSGSGRRVFDLDNGYVIKYAKNFKGIAQNKVEYQISSTESSELFAKITQISDDFRMVIMEKADRITNISVVWKYFNVENNLELFHLKELEEIAAKYNLLFVDLRRPINWGIVKDRPVIIDYGFTREVRRKYYTLF